MIRALARVASRWASRYVPDPFVIAVLLTLVTFGVVWAATGIDPWEAVGAWGGRLDGDQLLPKERGLWSLLPFAMQVCLTLVTGHALAGAPMVARGIGRLAARATTPTRAVVVTALAAMGAGLSNWALGVINLAFVAAGLLIHGGVGPDGRGLDRARRGVVFDEPTGRTDSPGPPRER